MLTLNRRDFLKLFPIVLGGAVLSPLASSSSSPFTLKPQTFADTMFVNGKVVTMDAAYTIVQAVAIKDGLILHAGSDQAIRTLTGPNTRLIDLRGRTLTPGLIDAHIHPQQMGYYGRMVPFLLPEVKSIQDMKRKLADAVAKGSWIRGLCVFEALTDKRIPNRQDLDGVSPANPVWIMHRAGHIGVANSMALKIANVSENTPNPTGGIIERDSKGNLTGILFNLQATDLILKHIPHLTAEIVRENILSPQSLLAANGVTSFQDNYVRPPETINLYLILAGRRRCFCGVRHTMRWSIRMSWMVLLRSNAMRTSSSVLPVSSSSWMAKHQLPIPTSLTKA
jgi:predicted amidohydrolase YtcJ